MAGNKLRILLLASLVTLIIGPAPVWSIADEAESTAFPSTFTFEEDHSDDQHSDHGHDHDAELDLSDLLAYQSQAVVEGQIERLYSAYFLRSPDSKGLAYWKKEILSGSYLVTVSDSFAGSQEFQTRYANLDDQGFVDLVYRNVLQRSGDESGRAYWLSQIRSGMTRGSLMMYFSESTEYVKLTGTTPPDYVDSLSAVAEGPTGYEERRGNAALERISYNWQSMLPGWKIEFQPQRSGYYGLTFTKTKTIVLYVRPSQSQSHLEHVLAHEMGHAVDVVNLNYSGRKIWREARGLSDASPWWPNSGANDRSSGAGDFAESFAAWQLSSAYFQSNLAGFPNSTQMKLIKDLSYGYKG